jgi:hypothetical protein
MLRKTPMLAGAAIAAIGAALFFGIADAQPVRQLTVPNVTVTAPAIPTQPPDLTGDPFKAYARNPYAGRYRVDENRFAKVPCADTRIAAATTGNCLRGYRLTGGLAYMPSGNIPRTKRCDIALDVVSFDVADLSIEADVLIMDPNKVTADGYPGPDCYVSGYDGFNQRDFEDINQVTRRGSNWHDLEGTGDDKSMAFSDGPRDCIAVRRHGPRYLGGYTYMLRASICRTDGASIAPADIARALAAMKIREYDPDGNLRPPPPQ